MKKALLTTLILLTSSLAPLYSADAPKYTCGQCNEDDCVTNPKLVDFCSNNCANISIKCSVLGKKVSKEKPEEKKVVPAPAPETPAVISEGFDCSLCVEEDCQDDPELVKSCRKHCMKTKKQKKALPPTCKKYVKPAAPKAPPHSNESKTTIIEQVPEPYYAPPVYPYVGVYPWWGWGWHHHHHWR